VQRTVAVHTRHGDISTFEKSKNDMPLVSNHVQWDNQRLVHLPTGPNITAGTLRDAVLSLSARFQNLTGWRLLDWQAQGVDSLLKEHVVCEGWNWGGEEHGIFVND
jgi:hypothetical protein